MLVRVRAVAAARHETPSLAKCYSGAVYCLVRQHQVGGDGVVGLAGREQPEHLQLARGKAVCRLCVRRRPGERVRPGEVRSDAKLGKHAARRVQLEHRRVLIAQRAAPWPVSTRTFAASSGASRSRRR
jgi:hypothetical protein